MNKTLCWQCDNEFEYDGEQYRDVDCPNCGVQNSIMNPIKPDWLPPEGYKEEVATADDNHTKRIRND